MKFKVNKRLVFLLLIISLCVSGLCGCDISTSSSKKEESVDLSSYKGFVAASKLQYPATNSVFRYNVYTHYVTISELLSTDTVITIPETIDDLPVIAVEDEAFKKHESVKTIYMGSNVRKIGKESFAQCINLETITTSSSLQEIGESAFQGCVNLKSIVIPGNVRIIPDDTFLKCSALTSVIIEESEKSEDIYKEYAARTDKSDKYKEDESNARFIDSSVFEECKNLKYVWIPKDIVEIEDDAFKEATTSLTIYGYAASEAAKFSAKNLINYKVMNKSSLQSIVNSALSATPQYPTIGETITSSTWAITLNDVKYYQQLNDIKAAEHQTLIVLYFTVKNLGSASAYFNGLNTVCRASGYAKHLVFATQDQTGAPFLAGNLNQSESLSGCLILSVSNNYKYVTADFSNVKGFDPGNSILAIYPH